MIIEMSRVLSPEERFLFELKDYAISLGCTCEYMGYDPYMGTDAWAPDHIRMMFKYNGKMVFLLEFDGSDRCEQYSYFFHREWFYLHTINEFKLFPKGKMLIHKIKKFFKLTKELPFIINNQASYRLFPTFLNENYYKEDIDNHKYMVSEQIKEKIKYMVTDNIKYQKMYDIAVKKNQMDGDFE